MNPWMLRCSLLSFSSPRFENASCSSSDNVNDTTYLARSNVVSSFSSGACSSTSMTGMLGRATFTFTSGSFGLINRPNMSVGPVVRAGREMGPPAVGRGRVTALPTGADSGASKFSQRLLICCGGDGVTPGPPPTGRSSCSQRLLVTVGGSLLTGAVRCAALPTPSSSHRLFVGAVGGLRSGIGPRAVPTLSSTQRRFATTGGLTSA
mmetsp:Transcript_8269/g.12029  ORF Transcript_8269/g.12029 Transcript_8269/m.12029 type:complete len:207 (+) Transcript_8269:403-1023(+)